LLLQKSSYTQQQAADCVKQADSALAFAAGCRLVVAFSASRAGPQLFDLLCYYFFKAPSELRVFNRWVSSFLLL
jgi:hypothetical protein